MEAIYPILFHGGLRVTLVQILEDPVMGREGSYLIVIPSNAARMTSSLPWFRKGTDPGTIITFDKPLSSRKPKVEWGSYVGLIWAKTVGDPEAVGSAELPYI
jgi:hypothetical protein